MKYLIFFLLFIYQLTLAQEDQKYMVRAGTRPKDTFTFSDIYLYPAFTSGKVHFNNKHIGSGMMNYNRFTNEIDFIQAKDTLALADQQTVKYVALATDTFYYLLNIGYAQLLEKADKALLLKRETFQLADRRRQPNAATAGTTSNGSYNGLITTGAGVTSGLTLNMVEKVDLIYRKELEYYFANEKGLILKADKKNLLRLFHNKKEAINSYLEDNIVDFQNAESLQELFKAIREM